MRKGRDGEEEKKKRMTFLVATTSLPAVYRPNADRWKAARSRQKEKRKEWHFLVATTSLPAFYRPNDAAGTTTAGTLHARANFSSI